MSHTHIRVKFSNLNFHLFNYNLVTSPNCKHCNLPETSNHYFFICTQYTIERNVMLQRINRILKTHRINNKVTLDLLLHGSKKLSYTLNTELFKAVHSFIMTFALHVPHSTTAPRLLQLYVSVSIGDSRVSQDFHFA